MNTYKLQWKEHEDKPPVEELVQADLVEHAGNLLIFAELVILTDKMVTEDKELEQLEHLVGADPYELVTKKNRQDKVPSITLMIPLSRVVTIRKTTPTGKGVH